MRPDDGSAADLSRRARKLPVSPTVAMAQRAAALRAQGKAILDFSVGEPDQDTPRPVTDAGIAALRAGRTRYSPAAGIGELRAAVASRYEKDFGVSFAPQEVAVTVGGKHALYLAAQALLDRGDEVIIPSPCWPTFGEAVRLAGGRPVFVPLSERGGFKITARAIAKAVGSRTRAVLINSPANPTGATIDADELRKIGDLARRRRFTILYDDTYAQLSFGPRDDSALRGLRARAGERLVVIGTASKSYCMTGWRIGWILGPRPLIDACAALASHSTQGPATFAQVAAVTGLTGAQAGVRRLAAEYRRRRDVVYPLLAGAPGVSCVRPEGGFYFFPNVSRCLRPTVPTTLALAERLLDEQRVAVVPGEGFGAPGHVRISFARPLGELEAGTRRFVAFLLSLREQRP